MPNFADKSHFSFPKTGKDVKDTSMLKPGASEASSTQTGNNQFKPYVKKHPGFGTLGMQKQQG